MTKHTEKRWVIKTNYLPSAKYAKNLIFCDGVQIASAMSSKLSIPDQEAIAAAIAAVPELLAACSHGAMSTHHPACSHGKSGNGSTCECHVKKCLDAVAKATTTNH